MLIEPNRLTLGTQASSVHRVGGWVDSRAGLNAVEKKNLPSLPGILFCYGTAELPGILYVTVVFLNAFCFEFKLIRRSRLQPAQ